MAKSPKIAAGSLFTLEDQKKWYAGLMGEEKMLKQERLAKLKAGRCICDAIKRKVDGQLRVVHRSECPKWKEWMKGMR